MRDHVKGPRPRLYPDGCKTVVSEYVRNGEQAPHWVDRDGQRLLVNCVGRVLR